MVQLGFSLRRPHIDVFLSRAVSSDPVDRERTRKRQRLFLSRHGRQPFLDPAWEEETSYELDEWVDTLNEILKEESLSSKMQDG